MKKHEEMKPCKETDFYGNYCTKEDGHDGEHVFYVDWEEEE